MTAVRAEGLGKLFHQTLPRYNTLLGRLRRRLGAASPEPRIPVWALRDLSFEVGRGECLGIAGPNGAGKSTLLALVAGILEPTTGRLRVEGRANPFLSIGAGMQPELSVVDNIEIRGILMGLRRREILRRVEAILEFAELPDRAEVRMAELSTGQAARVFFSTAAHCDPDILLADEALSAGDGSFREKCVGTFRRLRLEGRTVLFASHDEGLLRNVATRVLRLKGGRDI
ncbi:MAG: ABC transporter ATP-binding protein [Elusimicrobia bacterium]|nr:ABC transporter ATP-binding protein [Elusimicrobiota bacterium]